MLDHRRRKRSKLWDEALLKEAISVSSSLTEVLLCFGYTRPISSGNFQTLKAAARYYSLPLPEVSGRDQTRAAINRTRLSDEAFFAFGVKRNGASVKKRLIADHGVIEICSLCGLGPEWRGMPLVLQVDHIDGDHLNNLVENLRFICPNCHSQTDTFCGKAPII